MTPVLSYPDLAAAYVMRHGGERPTAWKRIARHFGVLPRTLRQAIYAVERDGLHPDANGARVGHRPTLISDDQLRRIGKARKAGYPWPTIAAAMGLPLETVKARWRRATLAKR